MSLDRKVYEKRLETVRERTRDAKRQVGSHHAAHASVGRPGTRHSMRPDAELSRPLRR